MKNKSIKISGSFIPIEEDPDVPFKDDGISAKFKRERDEFRQRKKELNAAARLGKFSLKEKKKLKQFKSAKIIVRNLPFKCNEQSVKEHFSQIGKVVEVNLLKKGDKLIGCGFVQFERKLDAAKAIAKLTGKEFKGRPIIIDWALPKDTFIKKFTNTSETDIKEEKLSDDEIKKEDQSGSETGDVNSDEESGDDGDSGSDEDRAERDEDEAESDEGEAESDEDESDAEGRNKSSISQKSAEPKKNKKYNFQYDPQDVSDGRTVFVKNVPFSATDEDLLECAKDAGEVIYAVICYDRLTEHSKGTGFIKFNDKSVVSDILSGKSKLVLKGMKLEVQIAVKKNQMGDKTDKKVPKDNRNLYLLREGIVLAGSPAAEGVSEGDMSKRLQLEHWKTQALRNLNRFLSATRVAVHNIPPFMNDEKLRQVFKENSPKSSVITEARVMRNLKDIDEKGVGKSKGFGFVNFTRHEHALEALRKINNNPIIFKENKRPIVGFSIENRVALREKEKRKFRSQNPPNRSAIDKPNAAASSSQSGIKRKLKNDSGENLPEYCGYTSKPGAKKMRSGKELKVQAALHHKAIVDKKRQRKRKIHFAKNFRNKKKV